MKLADLLAGTSQEDLERLAHQHAKAEEHLSRPQMLATIEGVLRSYRFLQDFVFDRQPPTYAILTLLLDAPEFALPASGFRELVQAETTKLCDAIDSGEILKRDDHLRVYRRALYQARSNDLRIDQSESAILGVLRQELGIAQVEHFLIEHHADLREFWRREGSFMRELHELRSAGLVFVNDGRTLIPEDVGAVLRQVLGIDMSRSAARRLFGHLSGQELLAALDSIGAPTSGSKEVKIERLVAHMAQPRMVLRGVSLETLRSICREIGAAVGGAKEDLVGRIVVHMAAGRDLIGEPEPPPPPNEPRVLAEGRFALLFEQLRGHQLAGLLAEHGLRRWGTKEVQVHTLWDAHLAESTLLGGLSNPELDAVLRRLDLKPGGAKPERIERLVAFFSSVDEAAFRAARTAVAEAESPVPTDFPSEAELSRGEA